MVIVITRARSCALPVDEHRANRRSVRQIAFDPAYGDICGGRDSVDLVGLHVEQADRRAAKASRKPRAAEYRNRLAARSDADAAAEKNLGLRGTADAEESRVLEKERPLLREEQREAIQVDLLFVDLHLREVGVDG